MKIVKICAFTVLCFVSSAAFSQQQPNLKQLEHDIITWKARDKAVNDVKSWAFKVDIACVVISVVATYALGASLQEIRSSSVLSEYEKALCNTLDMTSICAKIFGSTWLANLIASKYTASMVTELEKTKECLVKTQKTV